MPITRLCLKHDDLPVVRSPADRRRPEKVLIRTPTKAERRPVVEVGPVYLRRQADGSIVQVDGPETAERVGMLDPRVAVVATVYFINKDRGATEDDDVVWVAELGIGENEGTLAVLEVLGVGLAFEPDLSPRARAYVTPDLLRAIPVTQALRAVERRLPALARDIDDATAPEPLKDTLNFSTSRFGRAMSNDELASMISKVGRARPRAQGELSELDFVHTTLTYLETLRDGNRPRETSVRKAAAAKLFIGEEALKKRLKQCVELGLISPGRRGSPEREEGPDFYKILDAYDITTPGGDR